jgi:hypothetical protein
MPMRPKMGVATGPGLTALTRMPRPISSADSVRANERTAALVAAYTLLPGMPSSLAPEVVSTIEAPSRSTGCAFSTVCSTPLTLMSKSLSKCSFVIAASGKNSATPALANRMSTPPCRMRAVSNRRARSSPEVTSPCTAVAAGPSVVAAPSSVAASRQLHAVHVQIPWGC